MVDRIPKPPLEDIIRSAEGNNSEGYLHQLFFHYPKKGGIESLVKSFINQLNKKYSYIQIMKLYLYQKTKLFYS